ncbi:MAG: hypothetical protein AABN95_16040 [Acidobacteriota bacterium]
MAGDIDFYFPLVRCLMERGQFELTQILASAWLVTLEDDEAVISFTGPHRHYRDALARPAMIRHLRDAIDFLVGRPVGIRIVI